jgi:ABC-type multidrug transport system fused ATPase/permease subunit
MNSVKKLFLIFDKTRILRNNIGKLTLVPIVFLMYASLEIYVLKQLSNLVTPGIGIENLALFVTIYIFYTSSYLIQQYLTYHLPVFLAIEISGKLFDSLLAGNLFRRDGNAGDVYSLLIDEVKRFTHLVMTPLMMCLQRLSTLLVYLLVGIYLYGIKVLLLGLLIIPLLLVLNFQKKYRIEIDRKIIESQSIRSETVQTAQSDNIHISSYYPARFIAERFSGSTDVFFKTYANASILVDSQRVLLDIVILFSCVFIGFFQPNSQNDMSSKVMFILILFRAGPQVLALLKHVFGWFAKADR